MGFKITQIRYFPYFPCWHVTQTGRAGSQAADVLDGALIRAEDQVTTRGRVHLGTQTGFIQTHGQQGKY